MGFLKCLLGNHCDLVFYLALFLHIFSKGRILKICHPVRNLFHIVFQGILIHLFVEIVFPAEFRQFLKRHCHYPIQRTVFLLKIRIDHCIIKPVNDPDQFHGISGFCTGIDLIPECRHFFLQRLYASCKYITEYCNFQPV